MQLVSWQCRQQHEQRLGSHAAGIHFVSIVSRSRSGTPTGGCWGCCGCCCWLVSFLPPERTLSCSEANPEGQDRRDVNLGLRLFQQIRKVFRVRRIHWQVGQSLYKESLLRQFDCVFLHESRRYVCRFCTSHLVRVKKELLYRLHSNREKEAPNNKQTKQQTTTAQKTPKGSNLLCNSYGHVA